MREAFLGISAFYHDSAAALVIDGTIVAAAQEERFTRRKHDASFPVNAIRYVLDEADIGVDRLTGVAFYDKPYIKFERLLATYHACAPRGWKSFLASMPVWIKEKLFLKQLLRERLSELGNLPRDLPLFFPEHHVSHAASAFYPSPFEHAAILTIDGVGEWATTTVGRGTGNQLEILSELHFPHSLGLLYSAFTYYCGFRINNGEYKLMGLAPYADRSSKAVAEHIDTIRTELIDIREDGSFLLNLKHFDFATGLRMVRDADWENLFHIRRRLPEEELLPGYAELACAIQTVVEEVVLKLARTARHETGESALVMAGGVALNCVANGALCRAGIFDRLWIQPAAGDAGGALGAALATCHIVRDQPRVVHAGDAMKGALLGPEYSDDQIRRCLNRAEVSYEYVPDDDALCTRTAKALADGLTVGWFQGRMEFGPRALGNRSILADARRPDMQKRLNLKIKFRESFRPFAPSVLLEDADAFFDLPDASPYMLLVAPVVPERRHASAVSEPGETVFERVSRIRSDIPAVTHVDYSARVQTVDTVVNPLYRRLLERVRTVTGIGLLVNTSFNVRGEPIVCTPEDALACFLKTELDWLVMGHCIVRREQFPHLSVSGMEMGPAEACRAGE